MALTERNPPETITISNMIYPPKKSSIPTLTGRRSIITSRISLMGSNEIITPLERRKSRIMRRVENELHTLNKRYSNNFHPNRLDLNVKYDRQRSKHAK